MLDDQIGCALSKMIGIGNKADNPFALESIQRVTSRRVGMVGMKAFVGSVRAMSVAA